MENDAAERIRAALDELHAASNRLVGCVMFAPLAILLADKQRLCEALGDKEQALAEALESAGVLSAGARKGRG